MKRLGVLMPARNSYSLVRATAPPWISEALAVVPPMSKAMRSGQPEATPSRAAPTTPAAGPEPMKKAGFSAASAARAQPPFELTTSSGAAMPIAASPSANRPR